MSIPVAGACASTGLNSSPLSIKLGFSICPLPPLFASGETLLSFSSSTSVSSSLLSSLTTSLNSARYKIRKIKKIQKMFTICNSASNPKVMLCEIQHLYC
jgi:hypothetical protein